MIGQKNKTFIDFDVNTRTLNLLELTNIVQVVLLFLCQQTRSMRQPKQTSFNREKNALGSK